MKEETLKAFGFILLALGVLVILGLLFFAAYLLHPLVAVFFGGVLCVIVGGGIVDWVDW